MNERVNEQQRKGREREKRERPLNGTLASKERRDRLGEREEKNRLVSRKGVLTSVSA